MTPVTIKLIIISITVFITVMATVMILEHLEESEELEK